MLIMPLYKSSTECLAACSWHHAQRANTALFASVPQQTSPLQQQQISPAQLAIPTITYTAREVTYNARGTYGTIKVYAVQNLSGLGG